MRILIAEDEVEIARALKVLLEKTSARWTLYLMGKMPGTISARGNSMWLCWIL